MDAEFDLGFWDSSLRVKDYMKKRRAPKKHPIDRLPKQTLAMKLKNAEEALRLAHEHGTYFQQRFMDQEALLVAARREAKDYQHHCVVLESRSLTPKVDEFTWTTRDGVSVKPCDMDEQHLRNTVSWLQRNLVYNFGSAPYLGKLSEKVYAFYKMLEECQRRGIEV